MKKFQPTRADAIITYVTKCADRAFILQLGGTMKFKKTIKKPTKPTIKKPAPRPTPPMPKKTYYA